MSITANFSIYTGTWINWSRGTFLGATITLSQRNGILLTNFLGIFVIIAGDACWRILTFFVHQIRAGQNWKKKMLYIISSKLFYVIMTVPLRQHGKWYELLETVKSLRKNRYLAVFFSSSWHCAIRCSSLSLMSSPQQSSRPWAAKFSSVHPSAAISSFLPVMTVIQSTHLWRSGRMTRWQQSLIHEHVTVIILPMNFNAAGFCNFSFPSLSKRTWHVLFRATFVLKGQMLHFKSKVGE